MFQSTHPRGVRPTTTPYTGWIRWFQSTHPRGVRPFESLVGNTACKVSIHAPAWGATTASMSVLSTVRLFQSTHPRGVRRHVGGELWPKKRFNPRTRVGCDCIFPAPVFGHARFNPRTRVGCDALKGRQLHLYPVVSIHAPAWGATISNAPSDAVLRVSIHAPAWGATKQRVSI